VSVLILRGVSGAGKSTYAASLRGATICSSDTYMVDASGRYAFDRDRLPETHAKCLTAYTRALTSGAPLIVVDNLNLRRDWYATYASMARTFGRRVYQKTLSGSFQNIHGTPPERVQQMRDWYEPDSSIPEWPCP
jgi:predicted kinase